MGRGRGADAGNERGTRFSSTLSDSQRPQRETLTFVEQELPPTVRGFQAEGALACLADRDPFSLYFADRVFSELHGPGSEANVAAFIGEFRERPIGVIVSTHVLPQFPKSVQTFWKAHYVPYIDSVMLPGVRVKGEAGAVIEFEALTDNRFRWLLPAGVTGAQLQVDDAVLNPGDALQLEKGLHRLTLLGPVPEGLFTLAVNVRPGPTMAHFYSVEQIQEIVGVP